MPTSFALESDLLHILMLTDNNNGHFNSNNQDNNMKKDKKKKKKNKKKTNKKQNKKSSCNNNNKVTIFAVTASVKGIIILVSIEQFKPCMSSIFINLLPLNEGCVCFENNAINLFIDVCLLAMSTDNTSNIGAYNNILLHTLSPPITGNYKHHQRWQRLNCCHCK